MLVHLQENIPKYGLNKFDRLCEAAHVYLRVIYSNTTEKKIKRKRIEERRPGNIFNAQTELGKYTLSFESASPLQY